MVFRSFGVSVIPWPKEITCKHRAKSQKTFRKTSPSAKKSTISRSKRHFLGRHWLASQGGLPGGGGAIRPTLDPGVERIAPPPWPKWGEFAHSDGGVPGLGDLSAPKTLTGASGGARPRAHQPAVPAVW